MIIVDRALQKRKDEGRPLRVGRRGAGFLGRGIALQIASAMPGRNLVGIGNRHVGKARQAFGEIRQDDEVIVADSARTLAEVIDVGRCAIGYDASTGRHLEKKNISRKQSARNLKRAAAIQEKYYEKGK